MSSPNATRVSNLVAHHTAEIERVSPQTSPVQSRASLPEGDGAADKAAPASPTPKGKDLPATTTTTTEGELAAKEDEGGAGGEGADAQAANGALEDIAEGSAEAENDAAATTAGGADKKGDSAAAPAATQEAKDGKDEQAKDAAPTVPETTDVPLAKVKEGVDALGPHQQEVVRATLARAAEYPSELPLSASWSAFPSRASPMRASASS